jgi:pyrroline-5-carboxylate reductase
MNITFIGGGNMAGAILEGCLSHGFEPSQCQVVEVNEERRAFLEKQWQVPTKSTITSAIDNSDLILLAVKPQQIQEVAKELQPHLTNNPLIISIAAGIRLSSLSSWLGNYSKIIRAMPNMAALVHKGITGLVSFSTTTSSTDHQLAEKLLLSVGEVLWVKDEIQLDAVTAVSGSGPAYVFYFIEALQQAAETLGLSSEQATKLALKTFEGAAHLAATSSDSATTLCEKVTSKGGTTEAALNHLEKMSVKQHFIEAVQAAEKRAKELGSNTICA